MMALDNLISLHGLFTWCKVYFSFRQNCVNLIINFLSLALNSVRSLQLLFLLLLGLKSELCDICRRLASAHPWAELCVAGHGFYLSAIDFSALGLNLIKLRKQMNFYTWLNRKKKPFNYSYLQSNIFLLLNKTSHLLCPFRFYIYIKSCLTDSDQSVDAFVMLCIETVEGFILWVACRQLLDPVI